MVDEVQHVGGLARVGAVEPGEGLDALHTVEPLVDIHRAQKRLVEAGLVLVRDDEHLVLDCAQCLGDGSAAQVGVHRVLGELIRPGLAVLDGPGEGDEGGDVGEVVLRDVLVHRELVAHRGLTGVGHDHGLGVAVEQGGDVGAEVLDDDGDLLTDVVRVQFDPLHHRLHRLGLVDRLRVVVLSAVDQPECRPVGRVVLEHVEDEALLNGLLHRVQVERDLVDLVPGLRSPEQLQRLALRGRGEGEEGDVGQCASSLEFQPDQVVDADRAVLVGDVVEHLARQGLSQLVGRLPGL